MWLRQQDIEDKAHRKRVQKANAKPTYVEGKKLREATAKKKKEDNVAKNLAKKKANSAVGVAKNAKIAEFVKGGHLAPYEADRAMITKLG